MARRLWNLQSERSRCAKDNAAAVPVAAAAADTSEQRAMYVLLSVRENLLRFLQAFLKFGLMWHQTRETHQVEFVIEEFLIVCATVQLGRQAVVRVETTTSHIQPNLANYMCTKWCDESCALCQAFGRLQLVSQMTTTR